MSPPRRLAESYFRKVSDEDRARLIRSKNQSIRTLERQVAVLVSSCHHNIVQRRYASDIPKVNDIQYILRHVDGHTWWEGFDMTHPLKPEEINLWTTSDLEKKYGKRVWSFGAAECSICGMSFGWYCPKSPSKHCEYKKTNSDSCDHCGLPEERK